MLIIKVNLRLSRVPELILHEEFYTEGILEPTTLIHSVLLRYVRKRKGQSTKKEVEERKGIEPFFIPNFLKVLLQILLKPFQVYRI